MRNSKLLHVSIEGAEGHELQQAADRLGEEFPQKDVIVTSEETDVMEFPTVEEFVEEVSDRVVEKFEEEKSVTERPL